MNRQLVHIIIALFYFTFLFQFSTLGAQFSIKHSSDVSRLLFDNASRSFLLDAKNELYIINDRKLEYFKSIPDDYKAVQFEDKIVFYSDYKVYSFNDFEIKELIQSDEKILDLKQAEDFHVVCSESNLQFWNQDTSFVCPVSMWTDEKILDVWLEHKRKLIMTSKGAREVCLESGIEFVISKEGLLPNCSDNKKNRGVFVGSKGNGIWTYEKGSFKQLFVPGIEFPKAIKKLKIEGGVLWILSEEKKLTSFNLETQVLNNVAQEVDDFNLDKWNSLFISSGKHFIKNVDFVNSELPDISVSRLEVSDKLVSNKENIVLKKDENLTLYLASRYSPHSEITFEYKLDKNEWIESGDKIEFNNIKEGSHLIQLRASADKKYYTEPLVLKFRKQGSIMDSFWPFLFGSALLLLGLALLSQRRISGDNKRLIGEKEKMNLQLEVLKKSQQFGQLQLNPHFLFNTLNSINGLIALNENKKARKSLNNFSQMMRAVLDNSFKESISINDEIQFLEKYLSLEQLIRNDKFEYAIKTENISAGIPPMIIQPFVENAIIHGIKHKEGNGKIDIQFEENDTYIKVTVRDDGIGRKAAEKFRSEGHQSSALKITKDRLKQLDKWNKENPIQYEDLENPTGTKVVINIPKQ